MPRTVSAGVLPLLLLSCVAGCATVEQELKPVTLCSGARGMIFVADGAGNTGGLSTALRDGVTAARLPLGVEKVEWSYGPYRYLADEMDYAHAQEAGRRLACRIAAFRQDYPGAQVYLAAHSAGSAVVLSAAGDLPPDTVERIVLLGPAVSGDYDLRPALRSSRQGLDVFWSDRDVVILGLGVGVVGTTDRRWTAPAGRVGFHPIVTSPEDAALYERLHQHPWDPCIAWTGNRGGHFGTYEEPVYLRAYVLPLFADTAH